MRRIACTAVCWVWLGILGPIFPAGPLVHADQVLFDYREARPHIPGKGAENTVLANRSPDYETFFSLAFGFRKDNFDWSIAGNSSGTQPNILSELAWSDVESYQMVFKNRTRLGRHIYFRSYFKYAWIQDGQLRDSDYDGDDRTDEFSRSVSQSSGDQMWDLSFGVGYPFAFLGGQLTLAPLIGVSLHKQNFRITDGYQVLTWAQGPDIGPIDGLNSTYQAKWKGVWGGCDLRYRITPKSRKKNLPMELALSVELHKAWYSAVADWNLRDDMQHPVSFEQEANGIGWVLEGEWVIQLAPEWDLNIQLCYQEWTTDSGTDRVYLTDGSASTRLNEVNWDSRSIVFGATYKF